MGNLSDLDKREIARGGRNLAQSHLNLSIFTDSREGRMKDYIGGKPMGKEEKGKQAERKSLKKTATYLKRGPKGKKK
jgi:hypothetical protein